MARVSVPTSSSTAQKGSHRVWPAVAVLLLMTACAGVGPAPTSGRGPTDGPGSSLSGSPFGASVSPSAPAETALPAATASPVATAPPPATSSATAAAVFPLTVTDDEGTVVTLATEPERVVSLSPANTETVYALGEGAKLVGGTDADDFPAQAAALPDVATFTGVLIEQVVELDPDLVLAAGNAFTPPADIERLRDLGLPVLVVYAESVDEVLADIELIGRAIGAAEAALTITAGMAERIADVRAAADARGERPRVFYQIGSEPEIYGPAPESFIADMVALAGGEPITTSDPNVFSIPVERLIAEDPEVIVVGDAQYGVCPAEVSARSGWRTMTAVREGAVRPVDDTVVTRPGPRLAEGLAALAAAIHPDIELSPPSPPVVACTGP